MLSAPLPLGPVSDLDRGETWSQERLGAEITRRAACLTARKVKPGRKVLILHGGSPAFFADLLATWRVGACAICADPALTKPERARLINFVEPAVTLTSADDKAVPDTPYPALCLDDVQPPATAPSPPGSDLDDPALMLFTSGTSGDPKGVVLSFRALSARLALNHAVIGHAALERALCPLPTHFGHGLIGNALTPLLAGGALYLTRNAAHRLADLLTESAATFISSVPSLWKIALRGSPPSPRVTPHRVHIGSAPLSAELWRAVADWLQDAPVVNAYGMTEAANWIAGASSAEYAPEDGLIGRMWGGRAALRGPDGGLKTEGEGEIVIHSPALMSGYDRQSELTAAVLQGGWLATGDSGEIGPDGVIRLRGRLKDEINRGGVKIQPQDIEMVVEAHPAVAEACVFSLEDPTAGEAVAAAIVTHDGKTATTGDLRDWCHSRLRTAWIPRRWFFPGAIAKTGRGKVQRDQVRRHCLDMETNPATD